MGKSCLLLSLADNVFTMNTARVFILIAYVLTGPTFVTACGHSAERLQTNGSIQRTNSAQDMTAYKDLIEAVEVFASQGGEAGYRAWKTIESSPRQELIMVLVAYAAIASG